MLFFVHPLGPRVEVSRGNSLESAVFPKHEGSRKFPESDKGIVRLGSFA